MSVEPTNAKMLQADFLFEFGELLDKHEKAGLTPVEIVGLLHTVLIMYTREEFRE